MSQKSNETAESTKQEATKQRIEVIADQFYKFSVGEVMQCKVKSIETNENGAFAVVEKNDGEEVNVGGLMLVNKLKAVPAGVLVDIEFEGQKQHPTDKKKKVNVFKVFLV